MTECEEDRSFTWEGEMRGATAVAGHRIDAVDGGSTLTLTISVSGSWLTALFFRSSPGSPAATFEWRRKD